MSPRKVLDGDHKQHVKSRNAINSPRPTSLNLKQESHTIHKQHKNNHHQQQSRKPVIIYTYPPEVIHTKPNDFMALVQKLTGHRGSKEQEPQQKKQQEEKSIDRDGVDLNNTELFIDSSVSHERDTIMKAKSPMFNAPSNPYVGDIPLFTPNSGDYFCSPRLLFRFSDMVSSSPSRSTSLSPRNHERPS